MKGLFRTRAVLIAPELTATIRTLILPFPFNEGSLPKHPLRLTFLIAETIDFFEGFFGPLFFGFPPPVIAFKLLPRLEPLRPPLRLLSKADASDFFGELERLLRLLVADRFGLLLARAVACLRLDFGLRRLADFLFDLAFLDFALTFGLGGTLGLLDVL